MGLGRLILLAIILVMSVDFGTPEERNWRSLEVSDQAKVKVEESDVLVGEEDPLKFRVVRQPEEAGKGGASDDNAKLEAAVVKRLGAVPSNPAGKEECKKNSTEDATDEGNSDGNSGVEVESDSGKGRGVSRVESGADETTPAEVGPTTASSKGKGKSRGRSFDGTGDSDSNGEEKDAGKTGESRPEEVVKSEVVATKIQQADISTGSGSGSEDNSHPEPKQPIPENKAHPQDFNGVSTTQQPLDSQVSEPEAPKEEKPRVVIGGRSFDGEADDGSDDEFGTDKPAEQPEAPKEDRPIVTGRGMERGESDMPKEEVEEKPIIAGRTLNGEPATDFPILKPPMNRPSEDETISSTTESDINCPTLTDFVEGSRDFWVDLKQATGWKEGQGVTKNTIILSLEALERCASKMGADISHFLKKYSLKDQKVDTQEQENGTDALLPFNFKKPSNSST